MGYGFTIKQYIVIVLAVIFISGCSSDTEKKEKLLSQANQSFKEQEYAKAKIHLKNALKLDPQYVSAYQLLAQTHLNLNEHQDAFNVYSKLETLEPDNPETRMRLASIFFLGNRLDEARKRVDAVLEKNPDHMEALYLRAAILTRENKDLNKAKEIYQSIISLDPKQVSAYMALSRIQMTLKEFDDSRASIETALKHDPNSINLYKALYQCYVIQNNLAAAEKVLETLSAVQPAHPEPFIMLGDFYFRQKDEPAARKAFLKAIENGPENINAHMMTAKFFNAIGETDTAEEYIRKALAIDPDNIDIQHAYAEFYLTHKILDKAELQVDSILEKRSGHAPTKILKGKILAIKKDFEGAIAIFNDLLKEDPNASLLHYLLASSLLGKGDIQQAKASFIKAIEENPALDQARLLLANIYYSEKEFDLAQTETEKILINQPDNYNANILMGNLFMIRKEYDPAKTIFQSMIQQAPDNPTAYYRLGLLYRMLKEDQAAMTHFEKALDINANLMDVFTSLIGMFASQKQYVDGLKRCDAQLEKIKNEPVIQAIIINLKGNLHLYAGNLSAAEAEYTKAIELNPEFISPYMSLTRILTTRNKTDEIIKVYQALVEKRPDQPSAHSLLGTIYENQKQFDLAETHYKKSLEINSDFIPAMNNLAYLYCRQDRELDKALDLARRAKEKAGEYPAVMDTLGWIYFKKGLYDSAIIEFNTCIEKEPDNPMFHYHLGVTLYKKGDSVQARASLEKALEIAPDFEEAKDARDILASL